VAPEGLNCTLTGSPAGIRSFCGDLREWDEIFRETDFKITDGVELGKMFRQLSIRKTDELVAYGLAGEKAPSIKKFGGTHLEADEYHRAMEDPDAVIIDVRNAYESSIGGFRPPEGGAELIDPKMRNSIEFPKWLNSEETRERINGKKVLMYCTGGIRCERASALLNEMSAAIDDLNPKGVYHCRGGIERYVKTYQSGGYWTGKNYLFDKRMEQTPSQAKAADHPDVHAKCCLCLAPWDSYRGQFKCSRNLCGVPVIVCEKCAAVATDKPGKLVCDLCREGHRAPSEAPDLVGLKRRAEEALESGGASATPAGGNEKKRPRILYEDRLFVRRLPLVVTASRIKEDVGLKDVRNIHWLSDRKGLFYGSCILQLKSPESLQNILERSNKGGIRVNGKKVKIAECYKRDDSNLFDKFCQREYPPVGC